MSVQLDGAVDEVFRNAVPLHRIEPLIQKELIKLQISVRNSSRSRLREAFFFLYVFSSSAGPLLWFKKLPGLAEPPSCFLFV